MRVIKKISLKPTNLGPPWQRAFGYAADKLHNVRTILADYRRDGESIWKRFAGKKEGTLWYYRALSSEYQRRQPNRITRELEIVVAELERAVGRNHNPQKKKAAANSG